MAEKIISKFSALLLAAILLASAVEGEKSKVLVLHESVAYASTYSQYLDRIRRQGYEIEQRSATDPDLHLREWDDWKYQKLIIFASGIKGAIACMRLLSSRIFPHGFCSSIACE